MLWPKKKAEIPGKKVLTNGAGFDILSERLMRGTGNGLSMSESVEKAGESA
jgi:hypothetical protein